MVFIFLKKQQFLLYFLLSSFYRVNITFIDKEGVRRPIRGKIGDNVLYLAHRHAIPLEGNNKPLPKIGIVCES